MDNHSFRRVLPLLAGFLLLSTLTLVLLVYSIQFFSWEPVWVQLREWAASQFNQLTGIAAEPAPARNESRFSYQPPASDIGSQPVTPTSTPEALLQSEILAYLPEIMAGAPAPEPTATPPPTAADGVLTIAALALDAPLARVPVENGSWNLTGLNEKPGWLETTGAYPGDDLAMVVAGHVTLPPPSGGSGPFYYLDRLKPGDEITYRTAEKEYVYLVDTHRYVTPDRVDSLYQQDGDKLILFTCTGWDAVGRLYTQRLLVEAILVRTEDISQQPYP